MIIPTPRVTSSVTLTRGFRVAVVPSYLAEHSDPSAGRYVFGYRIRITNETMHQAQLVARRWLITDARGGQQIVQGEGVVGQRPVIEPGQSFVYSSFCLLATPSGTMEGCYVMRDEGGETFEVSIGRFYLVAPESERE